MTSPTTDPELLAAYRELVNTVRSYDTVTNWPLSDEERIWFVRRVMGDAKAIAESEPFLRGAIVESLGKFQELQALSCPAKKPRAAC